MLRKTIAVCLCLLLSVSSALAAGTLAPGKPAGIKRAQSETVTGAIAVGALVLIAVAGYAVSTHPYQIPGAAAPTSTQP
jgi:hypothetical protein